MSQFWSPVVARLSPYVAGEQPKQQQGLVKLNTNESPFGPSPKAIAAMQAELNDNLRLYPDPDGEPFTSAVAKHYNIARNQVFVGNSSDEVLAMVFQAFFKQAKPLLFPSITYNFYPSYCRLFDIQYQQLPIKEDFTLALQNFPVDNGGVIFANPNAPTGIAVALNDIEALLQRNKNSLVVVDEAYVDFGAESAVALIARYPNVLVVQTLSKSRALAGLRVGFAMGDANLITALERVKNSFNAYPLDRIAIRGATAAIEDKQHFETIRQTVIENRAWVTAQLQALGFDVLPSKANFVFCRHKGFAGADLQQQLRNQNILVRHFKQELIEQWLRVSIGTNDECNAFINALQKIVAA